jgi:hypothetical protein
MSRQYDPVAETLDKLQNEDVRAAGNTEARSARSPGQRLETVTFHGLQISCGLRAAPHVDHRLGRQAARRNCLRPG